MRGRTKLSRQATIRVIYEGYQSVIIFIAIIIICYYNIYILDADAFDFYACVSLSFFFWELFELILKSFLTYIRMRKETDTEKEEEEEGERTRENLARAL